MITDYKTGGDLEHMVVDCSVKVKEAIYHLNKNKKNIIFLVDSEQRLVGTLSDGDVRRAFSRDVSPNCKVREIMRTTPVFCRQGTGADEVLSRLGKDYKQGKVPYIPVLNDSNRVVGYYSYYDVRFIPIAEPDLGSSELSYVVDCVRSNWISSQGRYVRSFEDLFREFTGSGYAVAVSNGTAALHLALAALDIGRGDEVIVPSLTFIATANAVAYTGAIPVFADSEEDTWNIDPACIEKLITDRTRAIIPVHLYGQPCKMEEIQSIARKYELYVIEDAAEAIGAKYKSQSVGSIGNIGCFSFFGNKVITTGEGGMLVTDSKDIFEKARILRDHGMDPSRKYWHPWIGFNYRMTNLQAAVGVGQLERIDDILDHKRTIVDTYRTELQQVKGLTLPPENDWSNNVCWMFSVLLEHNRSREAMLERLYRNNIEVRPFFHPVHSMPPYKDNVSLPVCEHLSSRGLSLPSYPKLEESEIGRICGALKMASSENR